MVTLGMKAQVLAMPAVTTIRESATRGVDGSTWRGEERSGPNLRRDWSVAAIASRVQSNGTESSMRVTPPCRTHREGNVRAQERMHGALSNFKASERFMLASTRPCLHESEDRSMNRQYDSESNESSTSVEGLTMMVADDSTDHALAGMARGNRVLILNGCHERSSKSRGPKKNMPSAESTGDSKSTLIGGVDGNIRQGGKIILPHFTISEATETKAVCRILKEDDQWTPRLEEALWELSPKLHTRILARILKLQTNSSLAWKVFRWAESLPGFEHDSSTFYALIEVLGKAEDMEAIWTLINDMRIVGIRVKPIPFTFLISSYGRAGRIKEAEITFHTMREFNSKPNVFTYNALLFALLKAHKVERALFTFRKMLVYGCRPDDVTFNTLINGLCVNDHTEAAAFYLDEMLALGLSPDMRTFNIVISNYLKSGELKKALSVYESALKTGCRPCTITHSMLLDCLFKVGRFHDALNFFKEMAKNSHDLDAVAFTTFLHGLFKCKKIEMAFAFFESLLKRGCANVATFNVVLDWFCKQNQVDKAVQVLHEMKRRGFLPSTSTYNCLISVSFKDDKAGMGLAFATEMMDEGCPPDLITYTLLIEFFLRQRDVDDALALLKEMTERGLQPDIFLYNSLLRGLFRAGKITMALSLAKEIMQKGCCPDKTTYHLLNSWLCKQQQSSEALKFIKEMIGLGCDATFLLQTPDCSELPVLL